MVGMVVETGGIEGFAIDAGFKVQMLCGGTSCAACKSDGLASPDPVTFFAEVFGLVGVECFQSVGMADDDGIAISIVGTAEGNVSGKGCTDGVVREGLDVRASVVAVATIRADDLTAWKGISPVGAFCVLLEIDGKLVFVCTRVFCRFILQDLPLVYVRDGILALGMNGGT